MNILILGSDGMLGSTANKYFKKKYNVFSTTRRSDLLKNEIYLNLNNNFCLSETIKNIKTPDYIINCIGVIKPHINKNIENSIYINSIFPNSLAKQSKELGIKVIHITTDCVFSGLNGNYKENDNHDAFDIYGKTKSIGEPTDCMTIRTSIIGHEIKEKLSLLEWFLNNNNSKVYGYKNHFWNGVTTLELCKIIDQIITEDLYINNIRHIFSTKNSKYDMLKVFKNIYNKKIEIIPYETKIMCDRSLDTIYYDFLENFKILNFEDMIVEMKDFYEKN